MMKKKISEPVKQEAGHVLYGRRSLKNLTPGRETLPYSAKTGSLQQLKNKILTRVNFIKVGHKAQSVAPNFQEAFYRRNNSMV